MKLSEMTQQAINELTDEQWKLVPPEEKKSCSDCNHLKGVISWWCGNEEAKKARGTAIPGCILCPYWEKQVQIKPIEITVEVGDKGLKLMQRIIKYVKSRFGIE